MGNGWSVQRNVYSETYYTGKIAEQIAKESGVTFGEGTLKKIQPYSDLDGFSYLGNPDRVHFKAILTDGTEVKYRRQVSTNKAKITKKNNKITFAGVQDMYISGNEKPDDYNIFGCKGFVNVKGGNGKDSVKTGNRTMPDGSVQTSYMFVCHDDIDIINKTQNDVRYTGN